MTWKDWRAEEPTAAVVDLPEPWETESEWGNLRLSYEYSPRAVQPGYYASPELWYPIPATPSAFPLKAEVATLSHAGGKLAVELGALRRTGPVVLAVGSGVVAAVPTAGGARFYDASPGGYRPGDACQQLHRHQRIDMADGAAQCRDHRLFAGE